MVATVGLPQFDALAASVVVGNRKSPPLATHVEIILLGVVDRGSSAERQRIEPADRKARHDLMVLPEHQGEARLTGAKAVLVCWSKASVESMWVADEATVGREKGTLVPIAIDAVPPKLGFRQLQTIDFASWTGEAAAPEFQQLAQALRAKLRGAPPAPTPAPSPPAAPLAGKRDTRPIMLSLLAALAVAAAVFLLLTRNDGAVASDKSVAVLPFENRSTVKVDSDYGDWLSELISSLLGKAGGVTVISQTSASAFKGADIPLSDIAKKLGVALIVEGSVRGDGEDIVISAQLIDAATDRQVWAEIYERKAGNALSVQSEVAAKVAAAVARAMDVTIAEEEQLALTPTAQPKAFENYQEALKLYRTTTYANVRRAQALLKEAVVLDPDFALAWALLSRVHSYFYFNSSDATEGRRAAAEKALAEATRLAPDLAEVMLAGAYFDYWVKRDYAGARARFEKLQVKWPSNTDVLTALASITRRQGRWEASTTYFERAVAIDPLRPGRRLKAAEASFATRDFDGALALLDASLALWPSPPDSLPFLSKKAWIYQTTGRLDEAEAALKGLDPQPDGDIVQPIYFQAMLRRRPQEAIARVEDLLARDEEEGSVGRTSVDLNLYLGDLRALAGDAAGAEANFRNALDELRVEEAKQPGSADIMSYIALAYAGLGDRDAAADYAARAVEAVPIEKDALSGGYYLDVQARVWAKLGDADAAIPAIERLMKMPAYQPLTPELLRLDPAFDKLRADERFANLTRNRA